MHSLPPPWWLRRRPLDAGRSRFRRCCLRPPPPCCSWRRTRAWCPERRREHQIIHTESILGCPSRRQGPLTATPRPSAPPQPRTKDQGPRRIWTLLSHRGRDVGGRRQGALPISPGPQMPCSRTAPVLPAGQRTAAAAGPRATVRLPWPRRWPDPPPARGAGAWKTTCVRPRSGWRARWGREPS